MKKLGHQQAGYALVSILSITTALTISLGALAYMGGQRAFMAKRSINRTKALAYAEAGIEYAFSQLSVDFTLRNNLSAFALDGGSINGEGAMENSFGEGSFALILSEPPNNSNRYCIVTSEGKCGGQTFTAEIIAEDMNAGTGSSTPPKDYASMEGFNYPILSNGDFSSNGDVTINPGSGNALIHTNGDMDLTNKQSKNAANTMTTSGEFTKKTAVNGSEGAPRVTIPDIDLGPYEQEAADNGMVINVGDPIPNPVVGGILVIRGEGSTTISDDIEATIIADGSLDVKGSTGPGAGYALGLVSKEGDIIMNGNGSMDGLVHTVIGDFIMHGTPRFEGQLIINGTTTFGGTPDAFIFAQTVLTPPGTDGTTSPYVQDVRIGGWQE